MISSKYRCLASSREHIIIMVTPIEKKTEYEFALKVEVKPNSNNQDIKIDENHVLIALKSKPIKNKANKELLQLLKRRLNISTSQMEIVSGHKSRSKIINVIFNEPKSQDEIMRELLS